MTLPQTTDEKGRAIDFERLHLECGGELLPYRDAHTLAAMRDVLAEYQKADPQARYVYQAESGRLTAVKLPPKPRSGGHRNPRRQFSQPDEFWERQDACADSEGFESWAEMARAVLDGYSRGELRWVKKSK